MSIRHTIIWKVAAATGAAFLLGVVPLLLDRLVARPLLREAPGPLSPRASIATTFTGPTPPIIAQSTDLFEDITHRAGLTFVHQFCDDRIANIIESNGAGGAILDYDGDGLMDIYLVNSGPMEGVTHHRPGAVREPNRLYRNRGDGAFEDVTAHAGVAGSGYGFAAAAADYDNDGYTDLYVLNYRKSILYHNRGDGTFADVTDRARVGNTGTGIGAVFLDIDNDGWLDLFVANYLTFDPYYAYLNNTPFPGPLAYKGEFNVLYRNKGDGTFEDVSAAAGIRIAGHRAMSVVTFDHNGDGFQDIYLCNDTTPNMLLINDRHGRFSDVAMKAGVAYNAVGEAAGSMVAAVGDCNGDSLMDLLVSRFGYGSLYVGSPGGLFEDRIRESNVGPLTKPYIGWGSNFLDFDNDGDLDALVANGDAQTLSGMETLLMENRGDGTFTDARKRGGSFFKQRLRARSSLVLDFNNDGRQDVLLTAIGDRTFLLRNQNARSHHWLALDLQGTRSNRDGIGARIILSAGGRTHYAEARCMTSFLGQSDRRIHFGLGTEAKIERLEIRWPSGVVQTLSDVAVDRVLRVIEPTGKGAV